MSSIHTFDPHARAEANRSHCFGASLFQGFPVACDVCLREGR